MIKTNKNPVIKPVKEAEGMYAITAEEKKFLDMAKLKNEDLHKEQLAYNMEMGIKLNEMRIQQLKRQIDFKETEISSKTVRETHADYKDNLKPEFMIQNEIESIEFEIMKLVDSTKKIKEEQAKQAKK